MLAFPFNYRNFRVNNSGSQCPYDRLSPFVYDNAGDAIQYLALKEIVKNELHQELWGFNSFYPELISLDQKTALDATSQDVRLIVSGYTGLGVNIFTYVYMPGLGHVRPDSCLYLGMCISGSHLRGGANGFDIALKLDIPQKLKPYGPIGCRDRATRDLPDCMRLIPEEIKATAIKVTHRLLYRNNPATLASNLDFYAQAQKLIDYYRAKAKLIITSRVHGTLPSLAMGIPVIFMSDCTDQRMDMMKYLIKQYRSDKAFDFEQALRESEHPYFVEVSQAVRENAIDRILGKDDRSSIRRLEQILEYDFLGQYSR